MATDSTKTLNPFDIVEYIRNPISFKIGLILILLFLFLAITFLLLPYTKRLSIIIFKKTITEILILPAIILLGILILHKYILNSNYIFCNIISGSEYWNEFTIISITYIIFYGISIFKYSHLENVVEHSHWNRYTLALAGAHVRLLAVNTRDFSLFYEPVGVRYFNEQISKIINANVKKVRVIVIPGKGKTDPAYQNLITRSLYLDNNLNNYEKTFNNIYNSHKIHNIELHIVPQKVFIKKIKEIKPSLKKAWHEHLKNNKSNIIKRGYYCLSLNLFNGGILKILDSLIIDDINYFPTNKGNNLEFEELPNNFKIIIEKLIKDLTCGNTYNIDDLKEEFRKKIA